MTLNPLLNHLPTIGLTLDMVGALIIAIPDIPRLNKHLTVGALRKGKHQLESFALINGTSEYEAVTDELERMYDEHFNQNVTFGSDIHNIKVKHGDTPLGAQKKLIGYTKTDDSEDQEKIELGNIPYWSIKMHLESRINEKESKIRGIGFLLLATGFALQIIGRI